MQPMLIPVVSQPQHLHPNIHQTLAQKGAKQLVQALQAGVKGLGAAQGTWPAARRRPVPPSDWAPWPGSACLPSVHSEPLQFKRATSVE